MKDVYQKNLMGGLLTLSSVLVASGVCAQSNYAIEEVVVTARKGAAEDMQSVPLAINALSAQMIQEKGISGVEDISQMVSGLVFDSGLLPNDTRPTIRGLSTTRGRANVATLIDFVDVSSEALSTAGGGMTGNMRLTDLERVEVVKGPQSVLYGRSAFSGAINYITKRPSLEFEGAVDFDVSSVEDDLSEWNANELKLSLSGPINDELGYRINLARSEGNGAYDNPNTGGDLGTEDTLGAAFALLFEPNDILSSYTRVEYSDEEYGPRAQVLRRTVDHTPALGDYFNDGTVAGSGLDTGRSSNPNLTVYDGRAVTYNQGQFFQQGVENRASAYYANDLPQSVQDALGVAPGDPIVDCSLSQVPYRNRNAAGLFPGSAEKPGANQLCRPMLVGAQHADASEIDFSADPRTGRDFRGTELENLRLHQQFDFNWDTFQFSYIGAYTRNKSNIQEDFDLTDYSLYSGTLIDDDGTAPTGINCNGDDRAVAGDCIAQYGFQTAMDMTYDLEQVNHEFRFSGQQQSFQWTVSVLYWEEELNTEMEDRWWLREGGTDLVNSAFVNPGLFLGGLPYLDEDADLVNDSRDCMGADRGDITKGCYVTAADYFSTSPVTDWLSRETEHMSLAAMFTYDVSETLSVTVEGRYLQEDIIYAGSGSELHGLSSAFGNCGGFMSTAMGAYEIDPNDVYPFNGSGNGSTAEALPDTQLAGALKPDIHGECEAQRNELPTVEEFVPRFNITWYPNEDVMMYFTYAEGFKPGGVDTTNASSLVRDTDLDKDTEWAGYDVDGDGIIGSDSNVDFDDRIATGYAEFQPEYDPEKLKTYEVGAKTTWLEGRVVLNLAAFYYEYTDQQTSILVENGAGFPAPKIVNAGETIVEGAEFDITARLTERLTATLGYTYSDAYYEDFNTAKIAGGPASRSSMADAGNVDGDYTGNRMPYSARDAITWSLRYDTDFESGMSSFAELNGNYQSKRFMTPGNISWLPQYRLVNFISGIESDTWSAVFYINNLMNDDTLRSGVTNTDYGFGASYEFDLPQAANLILPTPRTYGLRLGYRF
ncbi:TonB-dependent receptor [Oceanicoccus sp. KOV_DT_Chl]|uniref:TonB-dependent receptor n=1 Tax=Oceanicoccus sp. KOV_DT_Chl TaxID=1904639 RepID=UPI000C7AF5C1|nr:TonB-dependent receptor [Oceanicoccus sp. KOV_DT_Chl]